MNRMVNYFWPVLTSFILLSCNSGNQQPLLSSSSGKPGDLIIVMNKAEWDDKPGEELKRIFREPYQVLPQYEPLFDIMQVPHDGFGNLMKVQRNILDVVISPRYTTSKMVVQKDLWAKSQLVVTIYASSDSAFMTLLKANETKLVNLFDEMERLRLNEINKKNIDRNLYEHFLHKYNVSLMIPSGFNLNVDSSDFAWAEMEISSILLNIIIYEYDYRDTNTFTKDYLINKRDQIVRKYIHGEVEGSYMITEREFGPFFSEYMLRGERYVAELRGLWKMEHGISMGGPFISITTLDEQRNKVVTVEGFVFAAGHNKRNYMRQVESIVLSMSVPKNNKAR